MMVNNYMKYVKISHKSFEAAFNVLFLETKMTLSNGGWGNWHPDTYIFINSSSNLNIRFCAKIYAHSISSETILHFKKPNKL